MHKLKATQLLVSLALWGITSACNSAGTVEDSKTSWLKACEKDSQCGGSLTCSCGLCQQVCSSQGDCGALSNSSCESLQKVNASCGESSAVSVCSLSCKENEHCPGDAVCGTEGTCVSESAAEVTTGASPAEGKDASVDVEDASVSSDRLTVDASGLVVEEPDLPQRIEVPDSGVPQIPGLDGSAREVPITTPPIVDDPVLVTEDAKAPDPTVTLCGTCVPVCKGLQMDEVCLLNPPGSYIHAIATTADGIWMADWGTADELGNHNGDGRVLKWSPDSGLEVVVDAQMGPVGIVADQDAVYWATSFSPDDFDGDLWKAKLDGTAKRRLLRQTPFAANQQLILDQGLLFWTTLLTEREQSAQVISANPEDHMDGGSATAGTLNFPFVINDMYVREGALVFSTQTGVYKLTEPLLSDPAQELMYTMTEQLSSDAAGEIFTIAGQVFYAAQGTRYVPLAGGTPRTLAEESSVRTFASDGESVYWVTYRQVHAASVTGEDATLLLETTSTDFIGVSGFEGQAVVLSAGNAVYVLPPQ